MSENRPEHQLTSEAIQSDKMAALGLLVAGVAHEINTPMGAIHSNNDITMRALAKIRAALGPKPDKEVSRMLGIIEEVCRNNGIATERIMKIVRSLKNFARLDEADRKKADLHEGLESTLMLLQHQLKNRIHMVKEFGDLPEIECHPNQLNQVFMNILLNASQAIKDRGTITVTTANTGDAVTISIKDTGVGIPEEHLSKIFDPGFTTKGVGVGTGLGLSICYDIVRAHGGTIEVATSEKGTTFTITIPLKA